MPARAAAILALAALALVAAGTDAVAAEVTGRVVGVRDGDTLDLVTATNEQLRVRLAAIDAPEMGQAYGKAAKRALSALTYRRIVRVEWSKEDAYGRIVGKVLVQGRDAGLALVRRGLAWHYTAYAGEQRPAERKRYAAAEAAARTQRIGLWREPDPVAPWRFRHGDRGADARRRPATSLTS